MLFEARLDVPFGAEPGSYDVTPDGQRFLMIRADDDNPAPPGRIHVVTDWFEEVRRRVPAGGKRP